MSNGSHHEPAGQHADDGDFVPARRLLRNVREENRRDCARTAPTPGMQSVLAAARFHFVARSPTQHYWVTQLDGLAIALYVEYGEGRWGSPYEIGEPVQLAVGRQHPSAVLPLLTSIDITIPFSSVRAAVQSVDVARRLGERLREGSSKDTRPPVADTGDTIATCREIDALGS